MQVFWFRHMFLLSAEGAAAVEQLVVQLLGDKKLEVQELAARTLSGLIQVGQEQDLTVLWTGFISSCAATELRHSTGRGKIPSRACGPQSVSTQSLKGPGPTETNY